MPHLFQDWMMLPKPPVISTESKLDVLLDAVLFMVAHSPIPHIGDALIADLHRTSAGDPLRRRFVDEIAGRMRARDEMVDEDDA